MDLFLCERKGRDTDDLIRICLEDHAVSGTGDARIERSEKGKPYLAGDFGVHFSVSHTGRLWSCLFSGCECGVDIQMVKDVDEEALSKRFFTSKEQAYVRENGASGFFDIWVRKEALAKCMGASLMSIIGKASVSDGDSLPKRIFAFGKEFSFLEADISEEAAGGDIRCAACIEGAAGADERIEQIWLKI